ncbi:Glycosyltransferase family 9 (heptosyltransferase) [uncultured archaeon]|nr:Glycosyltransferase family 9 (heptosyltransferase) [uncultured archaeon]
MDKVLNIGVSKGGGLGDNLNVSAYCAAIKRKFPNSRITLAVCRAFDVFDGCPCVNEVVRESVSRIENYASKYASKFDIFYEIHYAAKVHFSDKALELKSVRDYKEETDKKFRKYGYLFHKFLEDIPAMEKLKKPFWEIFYDSAALQGSIEDMFVNVSLADGWDNPYKNAKYVTLCNAAWGDKQTKCFPGSVWTLVALYLQTKGFIPIQVGLPTDTRISDTVLVMDCDNVFKTAKLLKGAQFNVSIEGGIAHLAKAVGTDSLVLFSSTPPSVFGYPNNINLRSKACSPCWWRTHDWMNVCPKTKVPVAVKYPECSQEMFLSDIAKALDTLIKRANDREAVALKEAYCSPKDPLYAEIASKLKGIVDVACK